MDRELAEKTALVVSQSSFVLDAFLNELKENLEPDEFTQYCKKFGNVMGEAYFQILKPIWEQYPDLLPEKMGGTYKTRDEVYQEILKLVMKQAS